ncbi:hypothetical protein JHK86_041002 [Glycine max]|nr:hypothetical protein JHK86_041002 [Glycine max]
MEEAEVKVEIGGTQHHRSNELVSVEDLDIGWGCWYTIWDVELATREFVEGNVIGEGGYAVVYRGVLHDASVVNILNNKKRKAQNQKKSSFLREKSSFLREIEMASTKKITLKSSDGETFEVEEAVAVAVESQTIKLMIEDNCADSGIPLPNVTSKILAKVIDYCKKHVEANCADEKPSEDELKAWDADFVKVDQATLFDLILIQERLEVIEKDRCEYTLEDEEQKVQSSDASFAWFQPDHQFQKRICYQLEVHITGKIGILIYLLVVLNLVFSAEWESETEVDKERMGKKGNITRKFGNVLQTLLYSVLLIGPLSAECKVQSGKTRVKEDGEKGKVT